MFQQIHLFQICKCPNIYIFSQIKAGDSCCLRERLFEEKKWGTRIANLLLECTGHIRGQCCWEVLACREPSFIVDRTIHLLQSCCFEGSACSPPVWGTWDQPGWMWHRFPQGVLSPSGASTSCFLRKCEKPTVGRCGLSAS